MRAMKKQRVEPDKIQDEENGNFKTGLTSKVQVNEYQQEGSEENCHMANENAVLVVSFGTSYHDSRIKTIEEIEKTIMGHFFEWECRRAFTSRVIIRILKQRDRFWVADVSEAAAGLLKAGAKRLLVQPTHVMSGREFGGMLKELRPFYKHFDRLAVGRPLLSEEKDYSRLVNVLTEDTKEFDFRGTEIVFMGHGTEHSSNMVYGKLAEEFVKQGYHRYHVGTVEAEPTVVKMLSEVNRTGASRVILQPLMIVAGDHANSDMAGDETESWKCRFQSAGYETVCRVKGLGELKGVRQMFLDHAREAGLLLLNEDSRKAEK